MQSVNLAMLLRTSEKWGSIINSVGCIKKSVVPVIKRYHTKDKRDASSSLKIRTLSIVKQIGWKERKGVLLSARSLASKWS